MRCCGYHVEKDLSGWIENYRFAKYPTLDIREILKVAKGEIIHVRDVVMSQADSLLQTKPGQLALIALAQYLRIVNKVADITLLQTDNHGK